MVYDKESGQVISLGELIKRTKIRCIIEMSNGEENFGPEMREIWRGIDGNGVESDLPLPANGVRSSQSHGEKLEDGEVEETKDGDVKMGDADGLGVKRKTGGDGDGEGERSEKRLCLGA